MLFNVKRDEIYMLFFKFENLIYSYDSTKSFEKFNWYYKNKNNDTSIISIFYITTL